MMARPESFAQAPVRKSKNRQRAGKRYEEDLFRGLQSCQAERCWAMRIPDIVGVDAGGRRKNMAGARTPADFIYASRSLNLLVECKAQKIGSPIRFDRLAEHQRDALLAFDSVSQTRHMGIVAVCWYNGERGSSRIYTSYMVPISGWVKLEQESQRKSIPLAHFQQSWSMFENEWVPGRNRMFDVTNVIRYLAA